MMANEIVFSLIVPTRKAVESLRRFLESLSATAANPSDYEVILVIDDDDEESVEFDVGGMPLQVQKVIVKPGLSMGGLNMAGYKASKGKYIMLVNDDVIVRTRGWDKTILSVFNSYADEIVLVHVNDLLFEDKLCTFPFVSRKFCEIAGGICPDVYLRYRIDDHIYNLFNLIAVLGHPRIIYLPDVVFEHLNRSDEKAGGVHYQVNEKIHSIDTKVFDSLLEERKNIALNLVEEIEPTDSTRTIKNRKKILGEITDSVSLRKPEFVITRLAESGLSSKNTRVTVGIVSGNIQSSYAEQCIKRVKQFTENFELIIIDNNYSKDFNHAREMNRILSLVQTSYLVLMDDDVLVEEGWLDGLLRCATDRVGVVTPMHKDIEGKFSYAGIVMRSDFSGYHSHILKPLTKPTCVQSICSALMLIDVPKCRHLKVDEAYSKYFLDIDYGFQIWEAGYQVVCSPYVTVTHIGGATLAYGSKVSEELVEKQRMIFLEKWVNNKRYLNLIEEIWPKEADIRLIMQRPDEVPIAYSAILSLEGYKGFNIIQYDEYYGVLQDEGAFDFKKVQERKYKWIVKGKSIDEVMGGIDSLILSDRYWKIRTLARAVFQLRKRFALKRPKEEPKAYFLDLVQEGYKGYNIIQYDSFYGLLQADGQFEIKKMQERGYPRIIKGNSIEEVKNRIDKRVRLGRYKKLLNPIKVASYVLNRFTSKVPSGSIDPDRPRPLPKENLNRQKHFDSEMISEAGEEYRGHRIFNYEHKFFCISLEKNRNWDKKFDYEILKKGGYHSVVIGHSLAEARQEIDRQCLQEGSDARPLNYLVFANRSSKELLRSLKLRYSEQKAKIFTPDENHLGWGEFQTVHCPEPAVKSWLNKNASGAGSAVAELKEVQFDRVVIPWLDKEAWQDNHIEAGAAKLCSEIEVLTESGDRRIYAGENLHRLIYNKAYLTSMFENIPLPKGKNVLEVGCSDGLVCEIIAALGAEKVTGVDLMKTVGCSFLNQGIDYYSMDGADLKFEDGSFDLVYSIATLEHVPDPFKVLTEILRVTRVGGCAYVQAGPLYCSPFGHHMFAYFQDYPWIHLRKSKEEIIAYAKSVGIDEKIKLDFGISCEEYVHNMINAEHVNGLFLSEYRLEEFRRRPDVEVLKYNISYEGKDLLNDKILSEIKHVKRNELVEHGFEILVKKIS